MFTSILVFITFFCFSAILGLKGVLRIADIRKKSILCCSCYVLGSNSTILSPQNV